MLIFTSPKLHEAKGDTGIPVEVLHQTSTVVPDGRRLRRRLLSVCGVCCVCVCGSFVSQHTGPAVASRSHPVESIHQWLPDPQDCPPIRSRVVATPARSLHCSMEGDPGDWP